MSTSHPTPADPVLANLDGLLPDLEALYKDVHAHPELSMQEIEDGRLGRGPASGRRLRGDDGRGQDRRRRPAPQRRRADGHAARRHGRASRRGSDRPALCQQGRGQRPRREHGAGRAHVRPRHARGLARGCRRAAGAGTRGVARDADGGLPTGRRDGGRRSGHDRRWPARPFPRAGRRARPARHGRAGRNRRRQRGPDHVGGRQPADPPVRSRRARLHAPGQHRSRRHGGRDGHAAPGHRVARGRRDRVGRGDRSGSCRPARRRTSYRTRRSSS